MVETAQSQAHLYAGEYLRQLLLKPGLHRDIWLRHVVNPRDGVINQLAVAEVLAASMRRAARHPGDANIMAYQLRELVSGALSGAQLSLDTLRLFIDSFELADHEAEKLSRLWHGTSKIRVLSGPRAVSAYAERELIDVLGPRRHQTLSLHDHVFVDRAGRIDRARMIHVIEAIDDAVDRIPFLCDTNVLTIEVGQGGKEVARDVRQIRDGLYASEILLSKILALGDTITLEYWLSYRFPGDESNPAEREFRRAVMREAQNLTMRVEFHSQKIPTKVWWTQWDGVEGAVLNEELMELDSQNSVHRYLRSLDRTVAGFRWSWD